MARDLRSTTIKLWWPHDTHDASGDPPPVLPVLFAGDSQVAPAWLLTPALLLAIRAQCDGLDARHAAGELDDARMTIAVTRYQVIAEYSERASPREEMSEARAALARGDPIVLAPPPDVDDGLPPMPDWSESADTAFDPVAFRQALAALAEHNAAARTRWLAEQVRTGQTRGDTAPRTRRSEPAETRGLFDREETEP